MKLSIEIDINKNDTSNKILGKVLYHVSRMMLVGFSLKETKEEYPVRDHDGEIVGKWGIK